MVKKIEGVSNVKIELEMKGEQSEKKQDFKECLERKIQESRKREKLHQLDDCGCRIHNRWLI